MDVENDRYPDADDISQALGRNFRRALDRAGVKPKDIINLTGASSSTVGNWRHRGVSREHAYTVAELLQVAPEKISAVAPTKAKIKHAGTTRYINLGLEVPPEDAALVYSSKKDHDALKEALSKADTTGPAQGDARGVYLSRVWDIADRLRSIQVTEADLRLIEEMVNRLTET